MSGVSVATLGDSPSRYGYQSVTDQIRRPAVSPSFACSFQFVPPCRKVLTPGKLSGGGGSDLSEFFDLSDQSCPLYLPVNSPLGSCQGVRANGFRLGKLSGDNFRGGGSMATQFGFSYFSCCGAKVLAKQCTQIQSRFFRRWFPFVPESGMKAFSRKHGASSGSSGLRRGHSPREAVTPPGSCQDVGRKFSGGGEGGREQGLS